MFERRGANTFLEQRIEVEGVLKVIRSTQIQFVGNLKFEGTDGEFFVDASEFRGDSILERSPVVLIADEFGFEMRNHLTVADDPDIVFEHLLHGVEGHGWPPQSIILEFRHELVDFVGCSAREQDIDVLCGPGSPSQNRDVPADEDVTDADLIEKRGEQNREFVQVVRLPIDEERPIAKFDSAHDCSYFRRGITSWRRVHQQHCLRSSTYERRASRRSSSTRPQACHDGGQGCSGDDQRCTGTNKLVLLN